MTLSKPPATAKDATPSSSRQGGTTSKYTQYAQNCFRLPASEQQNIIKKKEELDAKLKAEGREKEMTGASIMQTKTSGQESAQGFHEEEKGVEGDYEGEYEEGDYEEEGYEEEGYEEEGYEEEGYEEEGYEEEGYEEEEEEEEERAPQVTRTEKGKAREDRSEGERVDRDEHMEDDQVAKVTQPATMKANVKQKRPAKESAGGLSAPGANTNQDVGNAPIPDPAQSMDWQSAWNIARACTGRLEYSDGDAGHRPDPTKFTRDVVDDAEYLPTYFSRLKALWEKDGGAKGLVIDELPDGYSLWKFIRPKDPKHVDRKLYGHPNGAVFLSVNEFYQHFKWLVAHEATGGRVMQDQCPCQYCKAHCKKEKMMRESGAGS